MVLVKILDTQMLVEQNKVQKQTNVYKINFWRKEIVQSNSIEKDTFF